MTLKMLQSRKILATSATVVASSAVGHTDRYVMTLF